VRIKDLPKELRPRERMLETEPSTLTNNELLCIILGSGTKGQDVGEIAEKVFPQYAAPMLYYGMAPRKLAHNLNIPITHACKLAALFELGKRYYVEKEEVYITSPETVRKRLAYLEAKTKEYLVGIYLNARNQIIHEEVLGIGTVNEALFSPKEALEPAIIHNAVSMLIVHNHPSGNPHPSDADIASTKRVLKASRIMGIQLLDHIIIGNKGRYYSCKEMGML